jgi:peroxiredoxin
MVSTGSDAPDFKVQGLDGETYALRDARDAGPVLLVFWQAHCGACKMVAPYLNRLRETYDNAGWTFWTIAQDGPDDARSFVEEYAFRPIVLVDGPALEVSDAYDLPATPTIYLIEPGQSATLVADGFDKEALNEVSRRIAAHTGAAYAEIAPAGDGQPDFKPG